MQQIKDGSADLTNFGASDMLPAHQQYDLLPLVAELYGDSKEPTEYYAVAVVNKQFCDANPNASLASLKGLNMCSTGYAKTAGWVAPIGRLVESGTMPIISKDNSVRNDAESVDAFFGNICSPRTTADGPGQGGTQYAPLCTGCQDDCSDADKYYNYDGSFRCLMEGSGDVSFTKDDIVPTLAKDGSSPADWAIKDKVRFFARKHSSVIEQFSYCFHAFLNTISYSCFLLFRKILGYFAQVEGVNLLMTMPIATLAELPLMQ
jgi:melanoma-associated antigen p97